VKEKEDMREIGRSKAETGFKRRISDFNQEPDIRQGVERSEREKR